MNLKDTLLSEISHSQKDQYCVILLKEVSKVVKITKTKTGKVIAKGSGGGRTECSVGMEFVLQDEKVSRDLLHKT